MQTCVVCNPRASVCCIVYLHASCSHMQSTYFTVQELEARKLRHSRLGIKFHLRDLLGKGELESKPTTVGPLISLRSLRDR